MWKTRLLKLYSTPGESGAFSSAEKLYKILKNEGFSVTRHEIQDWLDNQYAYAVHKHRLLTIPRNPILAQYPDHNWQADILFLQDIATFNDNKPCILLCIDVITRYAWVEPMKSKKGTDTSKAFEKILNKSGRCPEKLQTDKGTEFYNSHFRKIMKEHNIKLYSTESDKKAAIAERCIKEIKKLIYRYLSYNQTNRYIDDLQKLVDTYNSTEHTSIGMAPNQVNDENLNQVLNRLYSHLWEKDIDNVKPKFSVGDPVRISISGDRFRKGYKGFWSTEIFTIDQVKKWQPYVMYRLKDSEGEIIKGLFYQHELSFVKPGSNRFTKYKKILKKKKIKGKLWYLVTWEGEKESLKKWIPASSMQ